MSIVDHTEKMPFNTAVCRSWQKQWRTQGIYFMASNREESYGKNVKHNIIEIPESKVFGILAEKDLTWSLKAEPSAPVVTTGQTLASAVQEGLLRNALGRAHSGVRQSGVGQAAGGCASGCMAYEEEAQMQTCLPSGLPESYTHGYTHPVIHNCFSTLVFLKNGKQWLNSF